MFERLSVDERRTLPPAIAVSTVAFALRPPAEAPALDQPVADTTLWIPLVRRTRAPFEGCWALPGGPTEWHETLADTALRTVHAAVRREPGYLEQLYAFGAVERSAEAQRLVTIAYWALYGQRELESDPTPPPAAGPESSPAPVRWDAEPSPAQPVRTGLAKTLARLEAERSAGNAPEGLPPDPNVAWFSADRLPELAFDHAEIIAYALWRLRVKTEYASVAHRFLGPEFTLAELRGVHEAIRGAAVDPANFRRQALASGTLVDTGQLRTGTRHRPAKLYRFSPEPRSTHDPRRSS